MTNFLNIPFLFQNPNNANLNSAICMLSNFLIKIN